MSTRYDDLEKLADLKEKGILTQDEFDRQKKDILNGAEPQAGRSTGRSLEGNPASGDVQLKRSTAFGMIMLTIITAGIYFPSWFLSRRESLNRLNSTNKVGSALPVIALLALILGIIFGIVGSALTAAGDPNGSGWTGMYYVLLITEWILLEVQSFKIRRILNDHFASNISGAGTFFFTFLCLQYNINKRQAVAPAFKPQEKTA